MRRAPLLLLAAGATEAMPRRPHPHGPHRLRRYNATPGHAAPRPRQPHNVSRPHWCAPGESCWPSDDDIAGLFGEVGGRVVWIGSHSTNAGQPNWDQVVHMMYPNWLFEGGRIGWNGERPFDTPVVAVVAERPEDVQAAVRFAARHRMRLSVKSTGHDFVGRSMYSESVLVYMGRYRHWSPMEWHEDGFDDGCGGTDHPPAVTVRAGEVFWRLYPEIDQRGYLTTAGGGLTVGASSGFHLGGGMGPMSPSYGLGPDNVLALDVVTPDGERRHVTQCSDPDLFWALRGGGGGTFAVVLSMTHRLYRQPPVVGVYDVYYPLTHLNNLTEQFMHEVIKRTPGTPSRLGGYLFGSPEGFHIHTYYLGDTEEEAQQWYEPLKQWVDAHPGAGFPGINEPAFEWRRCSSYWDCRGSENTTTDPVGYNVVVASRLFPRETFEGDKAIDLANWLIRHLRQGAGWTIQALLHGHVHDDAAGTSTSVGPWMRQAYWHAVGGAIWEGSGAAEDAAWEGCRQSVEEMTALAPRSGAYFTESFPDEPNWRDSYWGDRYERLLAVKRRVDPETMLMCRHCVGDESP